MPTLLNQATAGTPNNLLAQATGKAAPPVYPAPNRSVAPPIPNGVKAGAPGAQNQSNANSLASKFTAPQSAQTSTTNQGITPGGQGALPGASSQPLALYNPQDPYQARPGETSDQYNTRVSLFNQSQPSGTTIQTGQAGVQPAAPTPTPASFGGIIGSLTNQASSPYNQSAGASLAGVQGASQGVYGQGSQTATQAAAQEQQAIQQLQTLQNAVAQGNANIQQTPMLGQFQQGREQALQQMYGGQEQALATEIQGLGNLYGTGAQQQSAGITGLGNAATTALTGQNTAQSALQGAAGLTRPEVSGYGLTSFNPSTNTFGASGSGSFDPQTQATNFAQAIMSGKMTYEQATASLGYAGGIGKTLLDNAILTSGGNPLQLQASGSATQGVINTQMQQQAAYQSAHQQGQNLQSQLSDLITTFNLNPDDLTSVNSGIQKIASNVSDPNYKALSNYVADVASRYSQILTPPGGSATDTTRGVASGMLDSLAKGQNIIQVMNTLDAQAQAVIAGVPTTGGTTSSTTGGGLSTGAGPITWSQLSQ